MALKYSTEWDIDSYYDEAEPEEHWLLRKQFMKVHKGKFPEEYLVAFSKVLTNIDFFDSLYSSLSGTLKRTNQTEVSDKDNKDNELNPHVATCSSKDVKLLESENPCKSTRLEPVQNVDDEEENTVELCRKEKKEELLVDLEDCDTNLQLKSAGNIKSTEQWSPLNPDGKKVYDADFLLALRNDPKSNNKPDINPEIYRAICKKSGTGRRTDFAAAAFENLFMGKSSTQHQNKQTAKKNPAKLSRISLAANCAALFQTVAPTQRQDLLADFYDQDNSHPPSGESSARQTPQPLPSPNKEVQTIFANQVAQALSNVAAAAAEPLEHQQQQQQQLVHQPNPTHPHHQVQAILAKEMRFERVHPLFVYTIIRTKLLQLFTAKASFDDVVYWINTNVGERVKDKQFIRTLATAIFENCIVKNQLYIDVLKSHYNLLHRFVDNMPGYDLQCLLALQALNNKLEHPQGLLLEICRELYGDGVFSRDSFIQWEQCTDPAERAGKDMALKQLASFLIQLKQSDEEDSSSTSSEEAF